MVAKIKKYFTDLSTRIITRYEEWWRQKAAKMLFFTAITQTH